jgi:hypothetical protein
LMAIFVDRCSRIAGRDDINENILFLQKSFQVPHPVDHFAAFLEPAERSAIARLLQATWDFEVFVVIGKVVSQPCFIGYRDRVAIPQFRSRDENSGGTPRMPIGNLGLESKIHPVV